ncbi:ficolin-3-like [Mizuhopecten yessoensis]|uniref:Ficolin-3 n=1 Tax=Mizuhopecten yessoensis TaxID=6573 RepID=A0A210QRE0_MIZYE|nr:ficolin-3-like [Mizuhopecten yessoensis]OWF51302.1 Ficolin-3 [Mizuhopecten yessoensis]
MHSATATCTDEKYREVTKTIEQNHAGSVLRTSSWNSKLGCASTCDTSRCMSFSFSSTTKECKTYEEEICYRDDGVESSSLRFYTKVVQLDSLNNCGDVPTVHCSGVYTLTPAGSNVDVFCDMDTVGGPWTIIASRYDGSVDFYKSWNEYKSGFGSLTGEFWLGFENVRLLLAQKMKLRIEMEGWSGPLKYVEYDTFDLSDEASEYTLTIGEYSSPDRLYDALDYHNGRPFSTFDNDNDSGDNCAITAHGAWWYKNCLDSNLFGKYMSKNAYTSMVWLHFYANSTMYVTVKTVRMMLRKK